MVIHEDFKTGVAGRNGDVMIRFTDADGEKHVFTYSVDGVDEFVELLQKAKRQSMGITVPGDEG